jgi:hypothetical protein
MESDLELYDEFGFIKEKRMNKKVIIIGGGTVSHVRNHLALSAPAYGTTAKKLMKLCGIRSILKSTGNLDVHMYLTKMAGGVHSQWAGDTNDAPWDGETPLDIQALVEDIVKDLSVKIVFFNVAMVDFKGGIVDELGENWDEVGKHAERLKSRDAANLKIALRPHEKIISKIRKDRKDIFLVGFKTTCGAPSRDQYLAGLALLKESSCNLVLANDVDTRNNMIITPEEAAYHETTDREEALTNLVEMAYLRSHLTFTRSTVIGGEAVPWNSPDVPDSLRKVVNYCIEQGAYKIFKNATVGHFAVKLNDTTFLTSKRKTNFNDLDNTGLVRVTTDGPDSVFAYGSKPSVGGQSQRIVFNEHDGLDCILHFHSPLKPNHTDDIPVMSQREFECGSHECGQNTSNGLKQFGNLKAVMLDNHGPNIVFNKNIDPQEVIDFVERNWDLKGKTGGYITEQAKKNTFNHMELR